MTHTSREYAEALYALSEEEGRTEEYLSALSLAEETLAENPGFLMLLASPAISREERMNALEAALRDRIPLSMLTLMMKGIFCLMASFLLIATTGIDSLCAALRILRVPSMIVTLLLLTYRYVGVMTEELAIMTDAYHLRAPGQKGIHHSAWGSFLGQLLLRSMDRANELYSSMQLRAFKGEFFYAAQRKLNVKDAVFFFVCIAAFVLARLINITELIGGVFA
jgi:energy-coupling factor transporter transmembrane protein EcfT